MKMLCRLSSQAYAAGLNYCGQSQTTVAVEVAYKMVAWQYLQ